MTDTTDDNATTWRDLADQLTPEQTAQLAEAQRAGSDSEGLLALARHYAGQHLADLLHAELPPPAGAIACWHWERDDGGRWSCLFDGTAREGGGVTVAVGGVQFDDGTVERRISIDAAELTAARARQLAAALLDAADELDQLDG